MKAGRRVSRRGAQRASATVRGRRRRAGRRASCRLIVMVDPAVAADTLQHYEKCFTACLMPANAYQISGVNKNLHILSLT